MNDRDTQLEKMAACEKLATSIIHQFNNILATMTYSAELASYDIPEDSPAHRDLNRVLETGQEAVAFINSIMSFCKPAKTGFTKTDLIPVIEEAVDSSCKSLPDTVTLKKDLPDNELIINADKNQIQMIITELINNAKQSLDGKKGSISVFIEKSLSPDHSPKPEVKLSVSDNGPGIPDTILHQVFDPFFTTRPDEHKGLGLSHVYSYTQNHGGRIRVESTPDQMTVIKIYLPVDKN